MAEPFRLAQRYVALAIIVGVTTLLGACASGTSTTALEDARLPNAGPTPPISLAPIIGAPPNVSKSLSTKLASVAADKRVPVVKVGDKSAAYTLRGYIATSPDAARHKLSYIWDVTDTSGKRVHRITGEEVLSSKPGGNPWAAIQDQTLQKIAVSTVGNLATWLPTQSSAATPVSAPATTRKPAPTARPQAKSSEILALVPDVRGAPGDGNRSLAKAMRGQLQKKGIKLARNSSSSTVTVAGQVSMGRPSGGQQTIEINWRLTRTDGKPVRSVVQKNKIPQGSLDGPWGDIANAAAAAAVEQITALLSKSKN